MRIVAVVLLVLVLAGCGGSSASSQETIVAAFYPLAWAAEQVAGGRDRVVNLTPPGAEPHDIELTPKDVQRVKDAELVLYLGDGFMPSLEAAVSGSARALDLLQGQKLRPGGEDGGESDPHVWLAPARYERIVREIAHELARPAAARPIVARLRRLDREYRTGLARCQRREIVTSHAAFGYLADAYGLRQVALTGVTPEAEPSPKALEGLVREVERLKATTVFFETLVSPRLAETVARESGARTAALNPIEGLTETELKSGADYFSVMRRNLGALREAVGCR
jgi:zinc transport system substrate-binding protein